MLGSAPTARPCPPLHDHARLCKKLNTLVHLDIDAMAAYEQAMKHVVAVTARSRLEVFCTDHERHVTELSDVIRRLGGKPTESQDARGLLMEGLTILRSVHRRGRRPQGHPLHGRGHQPHLRRGPRRIHAPRRPPARPRVSRGRDAPPAPAPGRHRHPRSPAPIQTSRPPPCVSRGSSRPPHTRESSFTGVHPQVVRVRYWVAARALPQAPRSGAWEGRARERPAFPWLQCPDSKQGGVVGLAISSITVEFDQMHL